MQKNEWTSGKSLSKEYKQNGLTVVSLAEYAEYLWCS